MAASEYLAERQALFRRYDYLIGILQDRRNVASSLEAADDTGKAPDGLLEEADQQDPPAWAVSAYEEGFAIRAHRLFMSRVPEQTRKLLDPLDLAVGELDTANFSASTLPVPDVANAYVIVFTRGLSGLVYEVARAIAACINIAPGEAPEEPALPKETIRAHLHERLNHFIHLGVPFGSDYSISKHQVFLASSITTMAERFVYCHEISHVFLGHLDETTRATVADEFGLDEAVNSHEREFEADILGWKLLSQLIVTTPSDLQLAVAGTSLFLQVQSILEEAKDSIATATHPSARDRLEAFRVAIRAQASEEELPSDKVFAIEEELSAHLQELINEAPSMPGQSPLELLLNRTVNSAIPDYWTFQNRIFSLMSHSRPNKLCKALGRSLAESEATLRQLGLDIREASSDPIDPSVDLELAHRVFTRLKLVYGTMELYLTSDIKDRIEKFRVDFDRRMRSGGSDE